MDLRRVRKRSLKLREVEEYNEMQEAQDAEKRERDVQDKRQQEAQAQAWAAKRRSESLEDHHTLQHIYCARGTAVCTKLAILEVVIRLSAHAHISQQIHLARNMAGTSYEPCRTSDVV